MPSLWRRVSPYALSLGLSLTVVLGIATAPTSAPASAAVPSSPGPAVVLDGSGWGHSVGMSQYGARVMAQQGRTAAQVLQHYYPGTTVGQVGSLPRDVSVDLFRNRRPAVDGIRLRAVGATDQRVAPTSRVLVELSGQAPIALPADGSEFWIGHDPGEYVVHHSSRPANDRELTRAPDDRPVRIVQEDSGPNPGIVKIVELASTNPYAGTYRTGPVRGGALELRTPARDSRQIDPVLVQPLQSYLWGIAEMPSSWEDAALEAQAITARTYAGRVGGVLSATPANQAYAGWSKESEPGFGHRWVRAVDATSGVAVTYSGALAQTYYSSSHGLGRTEAAEDSWAYGTAVPYLRSVDDPFSKGGGNPYEKWRAVASNQDFAATVGLARVSNVRIVSRTAGGSPKALQIDGWTTAGQRLTCTWSGGEPCTAGQATARGAGAKLRTHLPLVEGGAGNGRIRSQQISSITIAPFTDDEDSVHQYNIGAVSAAGITSGCGAAVYCPTGTVERGQMATLLAKSLGLQPDNGPDAFPDIASSPHRGYINALARAGRIGGYPDGRYGPRDPVSREQIATFLVRAFDVPPASGGDRFDDIAASPHRASINAAAERGIAGGCSPRSYCPGGTMSRGQLATFLARAKGLGE